MDADKKHKGVTADFSFWFNPPDNSIHLSFNVIPGFNLVKITCRSIP